MIPELGQLLLSLAFILALVLGTLPLIGAQRHISLWIMLARPLSHLHTLALLGAFGLLTTSFLTHDFSVAYVAHNANTQLPTPYLISAVWGAHEGSLLLWALILALWTSAVSRFSRQIPEPMLARILSVLGLVSVGFLAFMLFTSNPFTRLVPAAIEGRDLNPLLQDPGLIFHPPMLYLGYVGFAIPFAFAVAAMLGGEFDSAWARWMRPWVHLAWVCLTLGITLGSWWAYYELGWGGWWFWDPVENASFMPWLVGTALMHSLAVTDKRGAFKAWTLLLAICAFSLSLLGTFLVRSGILTSVHAFAADPERGVFILAFLVAVVGGSLFLYALRAQSIRSQVLFSPISRETGLLLNNVLLLVAAAMILLGTLYPLLSDALQLGKISVGRPYFDRMFNLLMLPLILLLGIGPHLRWNSDTPVRLSTILRLPLILALLLATIWAWLFTPTWAWTALIGLALACWVGVSTCSGLYRRLRSTDHWRQLPRGYWGMNLGHLGIVVFIIGVTLTSVYSTEKDLRLAPGDTYTLDGYAFTFEGVTQHAGPNYQADRGQISVRTPDGDTLRLLPEKRIYTVQKMPMTEAAIDPGLTRDLFVALGEPLADGAWGVRLYHKPFIRWIWWGAVLMALGGLLAATDTRYRKSSTARKSI
ncbi:MAG: heme lyase CcmF/NrfE family subunit [Pseudomonadota bacterium]